MGAFGIGTLIVAFIGLIVSTLDNDKYGFKPLTVEFLGMVIWGVSAVGAVVFIGGRGILW